MNVRGTLPLLILRVLESGPRHGYAIAAEIKQASQGVLDFREGTLYPALHAHENRGFVESFERVEKGRRRRYYRLTKAGLTALESRRAEWRQLATAVDVILGEV